MSTTINEQDLIHRLRARDNAAFAQVFDAHADYLYRLALSLLNNEQSADGVVQDTFIALIENIDRFEGRSSLRTWLYRVAYNNCMGRLRKFKPDAVWDEDEHAHIMPQNFDQWQHIPDASLINHEMRGHLEAAIMKLSPALRAVFILRDVEEFSTEETAQALNISISAVKVRLHRARLALRESLAEHFKE